MLPFRILVYKYLIISILLYERLTRQIEWFFLERYIHKHPWLAGTIVRLVARECKMRGDIVEDVTGALYSRRGYGYGESTDEHKTIYWEAPLAITIWIGGKPVAGLGVEFKMGWLCIRQLQGVAGTKFPLGLRDWPEMFTIACMRAARRIGLKGVRLYRAEESIFYHFPSHVESREEEQAIRRRMRQRYDGTACKLKFVMKSSFGEWKLKRVRA